VQAQHDAIVNDDIPLRRREHVEHGLDRGHGTQVDEQIDRVNGWPSIARAVFAAELFVQENLDERRDRRVAQTPNLLAELTRQPLTGPTKLGNAIELGLPADHRSHQDDPFGRRAVEEAGCASAASEISS
jgi:hypothetical protein